MFPTLVRGASEGLLCRGVPIRGVPFAPVAPGRKWRGRSALPVEDPLPAVVAPPEVDGEFDAPSLVEPSVLRSCTSAVTDRMVGESGPNSSMTPVPANATLARPADAIGRDKLRSPRALAALCFATFLFIAEL